MELTHDYIRPTPRGGRCRVRIYQGGIYPGERDERPVVICTELPDNEGMSITHAAEQIAAEVLANHPDMLAVGLGPVPGEVVEAEPDKPCIWIEHHEDGSRGTPSDPATFDLVEFESYRVRDIRRAGEWRREIGEPSWSPLDRATVEALVGGDRLDFAPHRGGNTGSYEMLIDIWSEPDTPQLPSDRKGVKDLQSVDLQKVVAVHAAGQNQRYARVQVEGGNYLPMAPSLYEPVKNRWLDLIQRRAYEEGLTYKLELTGEGVAVTHVVEINV